MSWDQLLRKLFPVDAERGLFLNAIFDDVRNRHRHTWAFLPHFADDYLGLCIEAALRATPRHTDISHDDARTLFFAFVSKIFLNHLNRARQAELKAQTAAAAFDLKYGENSLASARDDTIVTQQLMELLRVAIAEWKNECSIERNNAPTFPDFLFRLGPERILTFYRGKGSQMDQTKLTDTLMHVYDMNPDERHVAAEIVKRGVETLRTRLHALAKAID